MLTTGIRVGGSTEVAGTKWVIHYMLPLRDWVRRKQANVRKAAVA